MDFQKQFDTVTGALNIFDMSYCKYSVNAVLCA